MSYKFNPFTGNFDQTGSTSSSGVQGAIQFSDGTGGFDSNASNLFWDNVNNRLKIGPVNSTSPLNVSGAVNTATFSTTANSQIYLTLTDNSSYSHFIGAEDSSGSSLFGSGLANALAIGTTASQAIAFHTNNNTNPRLIISASGLITANNNISLNTNKVIDLADPTNAQDAATKNYVDTTFIPLSEKAQPLGVASLDAGGKVPVQQLPNSIMQYVGVWNATTNTPNLADGVGNPDEAIGDVYRVSVAGTQDLGSGSQTFEVGDYVILNNGKIWEKSDTTDAVASVNGEVGIVSLDTDDIPEGTTNLYFTNSRAQAALASDIANLANKTLSNLNSPTSVNNDILPDNSGPEVIDFNQYFGSLFTSNVLPINTIWSSYNGTGFQNRSFNKLQLYLSQTGATGTLYARLHDAGNPASLGTPSLPINISSIPGTPSVVTFEWTSLQTTPGFGGYGIGIYSSDVSGNVNIWAENTNDRRQLDLAGNVLSTGGPAFGFRLLKGKDISLGNLNLPFKNTYTSNILIPDANQSNYVGFTAPSNVPSNLVWTLPSADGSSGQVLTTNGSGTLSWSSVATGSNLSAEQRTITALEETNKSLTLAQAPLVPNAVILQIQGAPTQIYGLDYTVSGTTLSWNGLGLDGLLQENDEVSIIYSI